MNSRVSITHLKAMRDAGDPIVCLTAYDFPFARIADEVGADLILVGDSVATTVMGYETTLAATMAVMVHHTQIVGRAVTRAMVVADLPFGSYQAGVDKAVENAVALVQAGASAVKLEGDYYDEIQAIQKAGIPVMGHLGMTPQSVLNFGGHLMQGKGSDRQAVIDSAKRLNELGVFGIVLELIPSDLAAEITSESDAATIGIGAGPHCHGQIQVMHDVLGLVEREFKHAFRAEEFQSKSKEAFSKYVKAVRNRTEKFKS